MRQVTNATAGTQASGESEKNLVLAFGLALAIATALIMCVEGPFWATMTRLAGTRAATVISDGRAATQMPAFAGILTKGEIDALSSYIAMAPPSPPQWNLPT